MRSLAFYVLLLFASSLGWLSATAHTLAERRVALVIANGDYPAYPLANPGIDVGIVVPALQAVGFTVTVVENADRPDLLRAVDSFARAADDAHMSLFYFAGHGFSVGNGLDVRSYLMASTADISQSSELMLEADGVDVDLVIDALAGRATVSLFFLDACRTEPGRGPDGDGRGFSRIPTRDAQMFIGLSTSLGDTAADGLPGEGSPFARAFAETIVRPGVSVDRAFNTIRNLVKAETDSRQVPDFRMELVDPAAVVLLADTGVPDREEQARLAWALVQDSGNVGRHLDFAARFAGTSFGTLALDRARELIETAPATSEQTPEAVLKTEPAEAVPAQIAALPDAVETQQLPASTIERQSGPFTELPDVDYDLSVVMAPVVVADIDACDILAADPEAHIGGVTGVSSGDAELKKAIGPCLAATRAHPDEPRFAYQLGRAYGVVNHPQLQIEWFSKAAAMGFAPALRELHWIRMTIATPSVDRASPGPDIDALLLRSIAAGDAGAYAMVARKHLGGYGVPIDYAKGFDWATRAAAAGSPSAMWLLGVMYENGMHVDRSASLAGVWRERSERAFKSGAPIPNLNVKPGRDER